MADGELLPLFKTARRRVVKWRHYVTIYERLLAPYRGRPITLIEVGVGDGGSLEVWRRYLGPSARIIGIDLDPAAKVLESDGFEIIIGDQSDPEFWAQLRNVGRVDVLIDDGGHTGVQQITTVARGLPHVEDGGMIVVEDTQTSYMPHAYPAPAGFGFMQFARHVVDTLHARNPLVTSPEADAAGLGRAIHCVEFHESMVVFHVDRRLCGPSEIIDAGVDALALSHPSDGTLRSSIRDGLASQPRWIQGLFQPVRGVLRAFQRRTDANRVRGYFR